MANWSRSNVTDEQQEQQQRSHRKVAPRRFDKTQLHEGQHGQQVHRDYAAHFFRWGWTARHVPQGSAILDVGCGQDQPLAKVLAGRPGGDRERYVGVDLNKINKRFNASWITIHDEFDFTERYPELIETHGYFDTVTCFEVIEHMGIEDGDRLLKAIWAVLARGGELLLSTPAFSGSKAANHVHEYLIPELQEKLESHDFKITKRWGTFGQLPKLRKVMTPAELEVHDTMAQYYGNDVLSVMFALNHPDEASNNLWVCEKP